MTQEEALLLKRGQPYLETGIKTFFKMVTNENVCLLFLFSRYVKMHSQIKSRGISASYFPNDIFISKHTFATFEGEPSDFFEHGLRNISKKIKVRINQEEETISFLVFIKKPDWKLEEQIYSVYGDLLDKFPDNTFNLELVELFGKKPKDYISKSSQ
ncbi:MAG: hypothetical protein OEY88_08410 [Candidatus Bathyarchaeota archaeon]|nr:hypothetical protein [Candidatus Bathyarchaeota archaeon]